MTSTTPKITAALTTIAILAPAASAQAANHGTLHPTRHFAGPGSERNFGTPDAQRTAKFQRDTGSWR